MSRRVTLILNTGAGHDDKAAARGLIEERLAAAAVAVDVIEIAKEGDVCAQIRAAVEQAHAAGQLIVAAGGDGTVNTVAALCVALKAPMGIIPMGTFNYFARDLGIPTEIGAAADLLATTPPRPVAVGLLQDRVFINNASFGKYAKIVRNREEDKARFGRYRIVALLSEIKSLYARSRIFSVRVGADSLEKRLRTTMIFAGINKVQMENLGMARAEDASRLKMAVAVLKPVGFLGMTRILLRGLFRRLPEDERVEVFYTETFTVEGAADSISCVVDGEIVNLRMPLEFRLLQDGLQVVAPVPANPAAEVPQGGA
ncbi:MAG TPA: diacylglycerol kinase family protein [Patescibacteria group bacterium]|nr:diacylglycerol kinase family protein [Patescibacteria group bacterium]